MSVCSHHQKEYEKKDEEKRRRKRKQKKKQKKLMIAMTNKVQRNVCVFLQFTHKLLLFFSLSLYYVLDDFDGFL